MARKLANNKKRHKIRETSDISESSDEPSSLNKQSENIHQSVLLAETLNYLAPKDDEIFVDATLGLGGHSEAILAVTQDTKIIGIDQDGEAIILAGKRLAKFGARFQAVHANFSEIADVLTKAEVESVDGVLADLGVSSLQFDNAERGFSFRFDAPLDMRMDADSPSESAAEMLERLSEFEIARIIYEYGEERFSRRIARRIVERRERGENVKRTGELAELVARAIRTGKKDKIHPATRTFQALRIAVNGELDVLENFIRTAVEKLNAGGRLAVISFHSLEDKIVKHTLQNLAGRCVCPPQFPKCACGAEKKIEILTRKPIVPTEAEMLKNPRARSAKLRACLKLN